MVFKCKICGGSLNVNQREKVTECEYCGVKQTIPGFIEPKVQEVYNRANSYLMNNEFDKAENLYNQILFENKEDADAYWNVLMCRYGVTYVEDPATGKYIPTCNRTLYAPIFNDENYQNAIKYANDSQKEFFLSNAKTIDDIQKGILAVSKKEKPFDIFISYKETNANGVRTKDNIVAQDLYDKLTAEGYKVFFSRITLEDKIGTEYEPYIYAALASSNVMITVSSSRENIEAVWVKNEWSRFLSFGQKDKTKTLIPIYFDMDKSELPEEFAHMTAYDMNVEGFEQELIRGINKLIPLPVMLLEQRKKRNKILKKLGAGALACVLIGLIISIPWFMKIPKYNAAMQLYFDENYAEATWAFDKLGNYRESVKMKEKAKLSWRKSLATTICLDMSNYNYGAYYISPTGNVEHLSYDERGNEEENLRVNEHGSYVSMAAGNHRSMYGLHVDGCVENSKENNHLQKDWVDIIQISPMFNCTSVALRSDGTMEYGNLYNMENKYYELEQNDAWLSPIAEWENIVAFNSCVWGFDGSVFDIVLIGIKADGTLCGVSYNAQGEDWGLERILPNFFGVKDISIKLDDQTMLPTIAALTKHNTIQIYNNEEFWEAPAENVVDVIIYIDSDFTDNVSNMEMYRLMDNGNLLDDRDQVLASDVVNVENGYHITKNGGIYLYLYGDRQEMEKAIVFDEWIERLN